MTTVSSSVPASNQGRVRGPGGASVDNWPLRQESSWSATATIATVLGIALLCMFWGLAVVVAEVNALIVGLALIACTLILVDFRVGVVLLILMMPISTSRIFPHEIAGVTGLNPMNLLMMGTLASCALRTFSERTRLRFIPRPLLWLYIAPIVVAGVMGSRHVGEIALYFFISQHVNFTDAIGYLRDLLVKPLFMVIFALLVGAAVARSRDSGKFLAPTIVSIWIMALLAVGYFLLYGSSFAALASSTERGFLSPLGLHANDLGRMYAIAYALLLFTWSGTRDYGLKLILLATMAMVVVALALTFSRGAFIAFILVNAIFIATRRDLASLILAILLAAGALLFLPDAVYERLTTGFGAGLNAITAGRVEGIWLPLLPEVLRSPLVGNGLSSMMWSEAARGGRVLLATHPHNAYLEALLDMGIVGLGLILAYFFHVWRGFRKLGGDPDLTPTQRGFYQGAAVGLVSFLVVGMAGSSLTPVPEQAFLWLAIGMMYGERAGRPGS